MKISIKIILLIVAATFFACANDDSARTYGDTVGVSNVAGQWYTEKQDNSQSDMFGEYTFTIDGAVYVDIYSKINGYKREEGRGTYSVNGNKIVTNMESGMGLPIMSDSKIIVHNSLSFSVSSDGADSDFMRIVGLLTLHVGDTVNIDLQKAFELYTSKEPEILSYAMTDDAIASVDESGHLIAKLIGATYLKIKTSVGTAVLKVSVSDEANLWNDFSQVLGKDFNAVERILGNRYAFRSDSMRYFYDSEYIDSVDIFRSKDVADSIVVTFKSQVAEKNVVNSLDKNLVLVKDTTSYIWFTDNENYLLSNYSAKYDRGGKKLTYTYFQPDWDDRSDDYGLTYNELIGKYGLPHFPTMYGIVSYYVKKDFVRHVTYSLRPNIQKGTVDMYYMYLSTDVTKEMIDVFLKRKYNYCNNLARPYEYGKNIVVDGEEYIMFVRYDGGEEHKLLYIFYKNS